MAKKVPCLPEMGLCQDGHEARVSVKDGQEAAVSAKDGTLS